MLAGEASRRTFIGDYLSKANKYLKSLPLPSDLTAGAHVRPLHLRLVPAGEGPGEHGRIKIKDATQFAWVLTYKASEITWYDTKTGKGFSGSARRLFPKRKPTEGLLYPERSRARTKQDHVLQPSLLSELGEDSADWVLASLAYLDGITSADVEGYVGEHEPLPPSPGGVEAALRKIRSEPQGFALLRQQYKIVGYASLWKVEPERLRVLFESLDAHGNIGDGTAKIGLVPGTYVGWLSSVRIHPKHRVPQTTPFMLAAIEKMLLFYAEKEIYFQQIYLRAHHLADADVFEHLKKSPSREEHESEYVKCLRLMPWGFRDDVFKALGEVYSKKTSKVSPA